MVRIFSSIFQFGFSLICYILVVKDLVGFDHDAGDIASEKVVVMHSSYPLLDCTEAAINATCSSRAWSVLDEDALRWSSLRHLGLCCLHLIELTFWDDDRLIRYSFYLLG